MPNQFEECQLPKPCFPSEVWDGTSANRGMYDKKAPDDDDYARISSEVISMQQNCMRRAIAIPVYQHMQQDEFFGITCCMDSEGEKYLWKVCYLASDKLIKPALAKNWQPRQYPALYLGVPCTSDEHQKSLILGTARHDAWDFKPGAILYLSHFVPGGITCEPPPLNGHNIRQRLGIAMCPNSLLWHPSLEITK